MIMISKAETELIGFKRLFDDKSYNVINITTNKEFQIYSLLTPVTYMLFIFAELII